MTPNDKILQEMMDKVSEQMVDNLKMSIQKAVEKEISKNLSKALLEGEFYRRINTDLQDGLKAIYSEISDAKKSSPMSITSQGDAEELFTEASDQLDTILKTTESATVEIMDVVEKLQNLTFSLGTIVKGFESGGVKKEDRQQLKEINDTLNNDLMRIMTTLSFQDLTGQRIKIIINTIKSVEKIVLDLYMSTGLKIKAHQSEPEKDLDQIDSETENKLSILVGPQEDTNQDSVDDLLSQLGL